MRAIIRAAGLALAALASSATAVGLGPLTAEGATRSDRKGFYLVLVNPYPSRQQFRVYGVGAADEQPQPGVLIPLERPVMGPGGQRRLLVVATGLAPGEVRTFRVCAERAGRQEGMIHARVCSKLVARRVA